MLESRLLLWGAPQHDLHPAHSILTDATNVVLVDTNLPDSALLVGAAVAGDKVFTFDGSSESPQTVLGGVFQWAKAEGALIGSLSILSHGAPGRFKLGDVWISGDTLNQSAASWRQLGGVLAPSAVIDIYSCDVAAAGGNGQALLDRIAKITGATVFASTNLTGHGGDWILEAESRNSAARSLPGANQVFNLNKLAAYPDSLATITVATAASASPSPGTAKTTSLSVLGASTSGESTLIYTWSSTPTADPVTYTSNGTNASKNVTATFSKAASYVFTCKISDSLGSTTVSSVVNVTVSQTMTTATLSGTTNSINESQTRTITAAGKDQFGNSITANASTWTWSVISGRGSAAFRTNSTGLYTPTNAAGIAVVQAASGGVTATFNVTVVEVAPTVKTAAKATPSPATGTTTALSVAGNSDGGAANLTYTWAATTEPTGANPTFSANGTNAAQNSTVTFNLAGAYKFTATINDGQGGTITSAVSVTVNQTLTSIIVAPSVASLNNSTTQQFAATGYDQFGNVMGTQPTFTWSVVNGGAGGSVSAAGLYTAPATGTGNATVKAVSGAVSGTATATVTTASVPATATPGTVTGTTTSLSTFSSLDTGQATLTYTWATTGSPPAAVAFSANGTNGSKNTTATFAQNGTYTIQASVYSNGTFQSSSSTTVTVNQTLTSIAVIPTTANLDLNQTQTFSASALDQFGNAMAIQPTLTWTMDNGSVGSFNTSTLVYSSGNTPGNATIHATSGSISGNAVVAVTESSPTIATAAAVIPSPITGLTANLSVLGASSGGESNLTYTWTTTGTPPAAVTFSDNGDNAAKNVTATFTAAGTYSFLATITDVSNNTVTSAVNVVVSQTLTTISVAPGTASLGAAGTQSFGATASDQFGAVMSPEPTFSWSATSGSIDQSGNFTAPLTSATPTITASSGGISGTASLTVINAAPTVATAALASPSPTTETTTVLSVLGADDGGESNLNYTWSTTGMPLAAVSFSDNGTNTAKNATATFSAAGIYSLQVTITDAGGLSTTSSVSVTVNQTLTTISVTPPSSALNENQTQQFSATGYDQFGATMASQPTFTWSETSGIGSINSSGLYTAPYGTGSTSIAATSGLVSGSASVTVSNATPTVATAATANPNRVTGTTAALSVLGADDGGESNLIYTWATTGTPPAAVVFSDNGDNSAKNCTASFDAAGAYAFTVNISDGNSSVSSSVNVTVNQTLSSITVSPSSVGLNENGTQQFGATGFDQFGASMATPPTFTWSIAAGVGSIDASGLYTAPDGTGTATVNAANGSINGTAGVTVTNAPPTVAAAASASSTAVKGTTTALSALGADDGGEPNLIYTWAATTEPVAATPIFSDNGDNIAKNSTVTFNMAGDYVFQVSISDGISSVTSSVDVTVDQTLHSITVRPSSLGLNENQTQQFSATGFDQFGASMLTPPTFTWSKTAGVGSIDSSALYTAPDGTGTATVKAAKSLISGTANITITNAAPTVVTAAQASPSTVTANTTDLSVLGADDGGESNLTYTWAATSEPNNSSPIFSDNDDNTAKTSMVTFDASGVYTFEVTISDGNSSITSSVNVTVDQTLSSITVDPSSSTLNENQTQQFSATGFDQFGASMLTPPTFTWSKAAGVGSVDSLGLYTAAGPAGATTVEATSGLVSGMASVTIINAAPTVATAAGASPITVTGATTNLSVLGADDGGEPNLRYTWAATTKPGGATPIFSTNGDNAAKSGLVTFNRAGNYTFTATISDGTNSISSSVDVIVKQTLATIAISPATPSINENATEQFTATGLDQFGIAMASEPIFTWDLSAGIGSIDSTGFYTSPALAGIATVKASSGSIHRTATITVINARPTVAIVATASPSTVTSTTADLSVLGADDGGESNLTYLWTVIAQPPGSDPVFSANASNAAKATTVSFDRAGSYSFLVTITDAGGASVNSSLTLTVSPTLTQIALTPAKISIDFGQTQQFTTDGLDQFGQPMTVPTVTWSLDAGSLGSIDANGLFTAADTLGSSTVRATAAGLTATATATVANAPPAIIVAPYAQTVSATSSADTLHAVAEGFNSENNLTYTWQIINQPTMPSAGSKEVGGELPDSSHAVAPLAVFSVNGTGAAKDTTVTFLAPGSYTFSVIASDGISSTTSQVQVTSAVKIPVNKTTVVSGITTIGNAQSLTGFVVTFDGPLDPATAQDVRGYRVLRTFMVLRERNALQKLLGVHTGSQAVSRPLAIASAVYDPTNFTVTLTLAADIPMDGHQGSLKVMGVGPDAVRDAFGRMIDGRDKNHAGGTFSYKFAATTSRSLTYTTKAGDIVHLALKGPGEIVSILSPTDDCPSIFLLDTDPDASALTGRFHKANTKSKYAVLHELSGISAADIQLGGDFHIDVSNP